MRRSRSQKSSRFLRTVKKIVTLRCHIAFVPAILVNAFEVAESCSAGPNLGLRVEIPGRDCCGKELPFEGLTTNWSAGIVPRLEHGAFLVLTCGGALLVETGRGINVIVA